ncbi:MAG TPA: Holliday junction resolvase RuvX [Ktedonobacteraceae bacterium]|nr:Holliday junction resolvase RuvX [Ktedonobacteraceae bacterium]
MTRLMALDVGDVRIGVALSDASGFLASPYTTLRASRDETQTWEAIERLIRETEAHGLVVGLPISLDGQIHAQGARVQAFVERLKQHITIPITFWDERLSTVEAQRLLAGREQEVQEGRARLAGRRTKGSARRRRKRQEIDALAAAVILQEYLDHLSNKLEDRTT